jgi:DNA-binding transcriptional ArsR family regulator
VVISTHTKRLRLFESSALFRCSGKHRTYVEISTDNALSTYKGPLYRPRSVERTRREEPEDPLTPYMEQLLNPSAWTGRKGASGYKAYTGLVMLAAEDGIVQDGDELRVGCDLRRLAEVSGTTFQTLSRSALPYLIKDLKLVRWRRGKGRRAGVFVIRKPNELNANNKVSTHFFVRTSRNPKNALETLRLIVRMRRGNDKSATLLRLGMPAMFTTIALLAAPSRGQSLGELSERTGRSKSDLRTALSRLKAAGIVREPSRDVFRLADGFAAAYQKCLDRSGVTRAERAQRRRHADDRKRRDEKIPVDKPDRDLGGRSTCGGSWQRIASRSESAG